MNVQVHFLGASETVTGSKYLIDTGEKKILVDCGMFQGLKKQRQLNWDPFPIDPKDIDIVLVTHGHLDHVGYLPRLVKNGFKRDILGTAPTLNIASIILQDSGKIQEFEAEKANKEGYTTHEPAEPLYNLKDAERAIQHFKDAPDNEWIDLFEGIQVRFQYSGHIIGATFIELDIHGKRFVFSGDIGRLEDVLMYPPSKPQKADVLFVESTYGDKNHPIENVEERIKEIVLETVANGGTLIIPSFAVERTQTIMYILWQLILKKEIPEIPMIMDSPMGANVLGVFYISDKWHKLSREECKTMCQSFQIVRDFKETWEVIDNNKPKIVIAGSGMITGGRVLTYLQQYLKKPETAVLLVGYQAEGTRGRQLLEGADELKIHGKYYPVKAKVHNIQTLSAHAGQSELLDWMSEIKEAPKRTFIVHGEVHAADAFRVKIKDHFGWTCEVPTLHSIQEIEFKTK